MNNFKDTNSTRNSLPSVNALQETGALSALASTQTVSQPVINDVYDNFGPVQRSLSNGETTDDRSPVISGTAASDVQFVHLYRNGIEVAKVPVVNGQWSWEAGEKAFSTGYNNIVVRGENTEGQLSSASDEFLIIVAAKPGVPVIIDAIDDTSGMPEVIKRGGQTEDDTPTLRGSGVAGSVITLQAKAAGSKWLELGSAIVDSQGHWQLTSSQLTENGNWSFRAKATNGHGSSAWSDSFFLEIEGQSTAQPVLSEVFDNFGQIKKVLTANSSTDDHNPRFSGTADSSIKLIYIYDGDVKIGVVATNKGKWSWEGEANTFGAGQHHITLRGVDAGGALSEPTEAFNFTVTAPAPGVPVIVNALDDTHSTVDIIGHKGTTSDTTPTLKGLGAEGSIVTIQAMSPHGQWEVIGSAVVGSNERWSFTTDELTQQGNWGFRVMSSNENGKSGWSSKFILKLVEAQPESEDLATVNTEITSNDILSQGSEWLFSDEQAPSGKVDANAIAGIDNTGSTLNQAGVLSNAVGLSTEDLQALQQELTIAY
ncbi:Ig-like domain-containing protein [Pantoea sp.]|uniref:Ig-like domain-containing protein n=1 Tax=Pantoea sp. TaxID=69393 RepID=UPI0031D6B8F4